MFKLLVGSILICSLLGCSLEQVPQDPSKGSAHRLPDADLVYTTDKQSPQFNQVYYTENQNPHAQIEREFRASRGAQRQVMITRLDFQSEGCRAGGANYSWFIVRGSNVLNINPGQRFNLRDSERLRVIVENPGLCQSIRLRFSLEETR